MRKFVLLATLAASLLAVEPLVTGEWLVKHASDKNLVIVDVSGTDAYEEGHIPGAMNSGIGQWRRSVGQHAEVRGTGALQTEMRRLGIENGSTVVVYSHHLDNKDLLRATYVLWALEYSGFKNSALLDGGIDAFVKAGGTLSQKHEADQEGDIAVKMNAAMIADLAEVEASLRKVPMVDSRPAVYYFGAERQEVLKRAGHISGAHSYFWRYNMTPDNRIKSKGQLTDMLEKGLGLSKNAPLIVYCTGGLEASMNFFVLHRVLGFEKAKLYDASMKEWANRGDTPMNVFRWE